VRALLLWAASLALFAADPITHFECNRCHDGLPQGPAPVKKNCLHCHQQILSGDFQAKPESLAQWQANIHSLVHVPSLLGTQRFRRDWLVSFLQEPHDLRPRLGPDMPRLPIDAESAKAIAETLTGPDPVSQPPQGDVSRGRALANRLGCGSCHPFSGEPEFRPSPLTVQLAREPLAKAMILAPDLVHVRARWRPHLLPTWLRSPQSLKADALMPAIAMSEEDAADLSAWLLRVELKPAPTPSIPSPLPLLKRPVSWSEVNAKVFHKICWHCHSDPDFAYGDGGPGNTGGFGFAGRGLSFANYDDMRAGRLNDAGRRESIFLKTATGHPRLLAVLWARHAEVAGKPVPGLRGMPLGLPPIPVEDIQLIESWIAQGRSRE
jgi:cytochrome c2